MVLVAVVVFEIIFVAFQKMTLVTRMRPLHCAILEAPSDAPDPGNGRRFWTRRLGGHAPRKNRFLLDPHIFVASTQEWSPVWTPII